MQRIHIALVLLILLCADNLFAQALYDGNQNLPPFGSFHGGDFDIVSLQNGNLHFRIPIIKVPQRGKELSWAYIFDTTSWQQVWVPQPTPTDPKAGAYYTKNRSGGWFLSNPFAWSVSSPGTTFQCPTQQFTVYRDYTVSDPEGTKHPLPLVTGNTGVTVCNQDNSGPAMDGSGIWVSYDPSTGNKTVTLKDGTQVGATREDTNGNLATSSADTLKRNPLVVTDGPFVTSKTPLGNSAGGPQYSLLTATDSNGNSAVYRLDYQGIDIQTSFCGRVTSFCHDFSTTLWVPSKLTLPTGTFYQFSWFNNSAGELQQVTLPTGGSIAYTYGNSCMSAPDQGPNPTSDCRRGVLTRTVTQNGSSAQWSYNGGTVTDPYGNDEVHTFSYITSGNFSSAGQVETKVQTYAGSSSGGTLLRTVATDYTGEAFGTSTFHVINIRPIRVTTTLDNGLVTKTETDYETFTAPFTATRMNVTERREYDYGSGSPGPLLRKTDYAYLHNANQNYVAPNIVDRVTTTTVYDGSGTQVAQTVNEYDNYSHANQPMLASGAVQHDASHGAGFTLRGNVTAASRWRNGTMLMTTNQYDDAGNVLSSIDPLGHKTSFDLTDAWADTHCAPPAGGQGKAYVTTVTDALTHTTNHTYYSCTALLGSTTDPNKQATTFSYDVLARLSSVVYPKQIVNGTAINGSTTYIYTDVAGSPSVEKKKNIDASRSTDEFFYFDSLGRPASHSMANGESTAYDKMDTCYDALDRKSFVSSPYQASSSSAAQVCSGNGDSYGYDALSRLTSVTHADGSSMHTNYVGRATSVLDEGNGSGPVQRVSQVDGLGRLTSVCEVTSTTMIGSTGTPAPCSQDIAATGFLTTYGYDALGNLLSVNQNGLNTRTFAYDSLSRLLCAANPEVGGSASCPTPDPGTYTAGTTRYAYDAMGNVTARARPAPNQSSSSTTVTTSYQYDAVNRLTSTTYSDSTPAVTFNYDQSSVWSLTLTNPVGRLTQTLTGSTSAPTTRQVFSYDSMGRVLLNAQCTPTSCGKSTFSLSYGYDLLGDVTSSTNGKGVTLTPSYNIAQRLTGLTSSLSDTNHPGTLVSGIHYNPFGNETAALLGNGIKESRTYMTRGWLESVTAGSSSSTPGSPATATVSIAGAEQSLPIPGAAGSGIVTITGSANTPHYVCPPGCVGCARSCSQTVYDHGTVSITCNGLTKSTIYDHTTTDASVASSLASAFNSDSNSSVNASIPSSTTNVLDLVSKSLGAATDYPLSATSATGSPYFSSASYTATPSGPTLTGGKDPTTIYDKGTVTITTDAFSLSVNYGQGSTAASIATALAGALNSDDDSPVTASASSNAVSLTSKFDGALGNYYTLAASSSTSQSGYFSSPSFTATTSGSALTGGTDGSGVAYSLNVVYADNGNVRSVTDRVNGSWVYGYDDFNRLSSSNKDNGQQTFTYDYDRFGNRWHQNAPQGGPAPQVAFDNNNHVTGYTYDAAGNVQNDGSGNSYTYDAENRLTALNGGATAQYVYDAQGRRVEKILAGVATDFLYDTSGRAITDVNSSGSWLRGEVYAGSRHLVTYYNSTTYFVHADWLGTERSRTLPNGSVAETCTSLAFGDALTCTGTEPSTRHFTGKERDSESGLDNFGVRYQASTLGRFMAPDSHAPSISNPQSWNKYIYTFNNPLRFLDPDGRFPTESHIMWTTAALNQLGFSNASSFSTSVNKIDDINHFTENVLHGLSGENAYKGARFGLLSIAADACSFTCSGAGESAVALVLGLHLVQDFQAHKGLNGLIDHFLKYGFGDADPNSASGQQAQNETQKFLADFKNLLVANLGSEGAQEALLKIQAAASQLTQNGIKTYVNQIYHELTAPAEKPTQDPITGPISTTTHMEEEAKRQCELGNRAACD